MIDLPAGSGSGSGAAAPKVTNPVVRITVATKSQ